MIINVPVPQWLNLFRVLDHVCQTNILDTFSKIDIHGLLYIFMSSKIIAPEENCPQP